MDQQRARWRTVAGRRPGMGDGALGAALRCEDEGALREFFLRFRPDLLLAARRLGVDPGERDAVVDDCLADMAVVSSRPPRPRRARCRPIWPGASGTGCSTISERAHAPTGGCSRSPPRPDDAAPPGSSEHAVRSSSGRSDVPSLSPALVRLAAALEAPLTDEERLLVVWMSRLVPHAEIAAWLGIAPKTAAKRMERLRERLQLAAFAHLEHVESDERRELLLFLDRSSLAPRPAARLAAVRRVGETP